MVRRCTMAQYGAVVRATCGHGAARASRGGAGVTRRGPGASGGGAAAQGNGFVTLAGVNANTRPWPSRWHGLELGMPLAFTAFMNRSYNVLLVDDEPQILLSLQRTLRGVGLELFTATTAKEALALLKGQPIDAVISDHDMPEMKGLELLQRIRISYPDVIRMLLTGRADVNLAIRALNEGAVHKFLLKPWDRIDLRGMVGLALRTARPSMDSQAEPVPEQPA
jgi:CheY-like chemotaxis protein